MIIKDLIKELQKYPPNHKVKIPVEITYELPKTEEEIVAVKGELDIGQILFPINDVKLMNDDDKEDYIFINYNVEEYIKYKESMKSLDKQEAK